MKQLELINKRAKARFCAWMTYDDISGWKICGQPATMEIKDAAYCQKHEGTAQKYFGQGKPIYALDATGV